MRIVIISEEFTGVPDEGMKKFSIKLLGVLSRNDSVTGIAVSHKEKPDVSDEFIPVYTNRLFLSMMLYTVLKRAQPELIIYSSASCGNFFAMLRMKIIKQYVPNAKIAMIVFQPVRYKWLEKLFLPFLMPDFIITQSPKSKESFSFSKEKVFFVPAGVDVSKFIPVEKGLKASIRERFGLGADDFVILHVGHINRNRGVQTLAHLSRQSDAKILLVGSTSTQEDENLKEELRDSGVRVLRQYFSKIEELYQMTDLYVFPVQNEDASTAVPLSVLEAMSCNVPVLSTPFGGLPYMFKDGEGIYFFQSEKELFEKVDFLKNIQAEHNCRQFVASYDWQKIGDMILRIASGDF